MPVRLTDKLQGVKPRGSKAGALAYAREMGAPEEAGTRADGTRNPTFLVDFFDEAWIICEALNWDYAIFTGQSANETGKWSKKNPNWYILGNPGGLAITNSENKSLTYPDGRSAARALAVHWWVYLNGALKPGDYLYPYRNLDGHYQEAVDGINPYSTKKPYAKSVKTLADFNPEGQWAYLEGEPPPYGTRIMQDANAMWPILADQQAAPDQPAEVPPMAKDPFDIIRKYAVFAPVTKRSAGQGFDYGDRDAIALAQHETQGRGSGPWYQKFFSCVTKTPVDSCKQYGICSDGERCEDAMVDYLIPRDEKKIYIFNDPFTSNMIPYATGGGKAGPNRNNPDGKAVDNKYGSQYGGVNRVFAAVEVVKNDNEHMTDDQIELTALLTAYIAAMNGYPANDWKYPDSLGGNIPTSADHARLSMGTNCQQYPDDRAKFEALVAPILNDFYGTGGGVGTGGGGSPTDGPPTPPPPPPVVELVPGVDWGIAARAFGTRLPGYQLTEGGPLSTIYIERCKDEGEWPELVYRWTYADGRAYFVFSNGWMALDPPGNKTPIAWIEPEITPA